VAIFFSVAVKQNIISTCRVTSFGHNFVFINCETICIMFLQDETFVMYIKMSSDKDFDTWKQLAKVILL